MKKDDFKKAINNINPDAYMDNRLKAKIFSVAVTAKKNKQIVKSITAFCLAFAIIFSIGILSPTPKPSSQQDPIANTVRQNKIAKPFIMIASAATTESTEITAEHKVLELNKEYPYEVFLEVKDIRGLPNDEISKTVREMDDIFKRYCTENNFDTAKATVCSTENIVLSQCSLNNFKLSFENTENIKTINVKNTSKYGHMAYIVNNNPDFNMHKRGNNFTINGADFDFEEGCFYWDHTEEMEKAYDKNINTAFSTFNDTITFTVEYTDGSRSIGIVDLVFDKNGSAVALCKDYDYISSNEMQRFSRP